jgi:hypothetical protein
MSDKAAEQPCERCGHRLNAHMVAGELRTGPCRATGCNCPMPRPPAAPGRPVTGGPGDDTPTTPGSRPQPTQRDYEVARDCVTYDLGASMDRVAEALAAERQRAIAPFTALADELINGDNEPGWAADPDYWGGLADAADRIQEVARRAAEDATR